MRRSCRVSLCAVLVSVVLGVAARPASADVFTPIPAPPTVAIVSAPSPIQPKYPDSGGSPTDGGVYTLTATVSTNATLAALSTVSMCWHRSGTDTTCSTLDPKSAFQMVWTESTAAAASGEQVGRAGFSVSTSASFATNRYGNVGSQVETTTDTASYDPAAQAMTIKFSFRVSSAMGAASDWVARVTAVYDENLCNNAPCPGVTLAERTGAASVELRVVSYWGALATNQERMGFGVIGENSTSDLRTMNSFEYVANATSDYALEGTDFLFDANDTSAPGAGVDSLALRAPATRLEGEVAVPLTGAELLEAKQVRLECKAIAPVPTSTALRTIGTSSVSLGVTITATGEAPITTGEISCQLSYSSGATNALQIYSSIVTLSILQT